MTFEMSILCLKSQIEFLLRYLSTDMKSKFLGPSTMIRIPQSELQRSEKSWFTCSYLRDVRAVLAQTMRMRNNYAI